MIEILSNTGLELTVRNPPNGTPWTVNIGHAMQLAMIRRDNGMNNDADLLYAEIEKMRKFTETPSLLRTAPLPSSASHQSQLSPSAE